MKKCSIIWFFISLIIAIFSYAYIDLNLRLTTNPTVETFFQSFRSLMFTHRIAFSAFYVCLLAITIILWMYILSKTKDNTVLGKQILLWIGAAIIMFSISYPFLSYDVFNYITTAKVTFAWHENPYVVMPIEIPNEPNLAFTRASNKYALYGPTWLLFTWIPYVLGGRDIWRTILSFKLAAAFWYVGFCLLILRVTKSMRNVVYFAFNPLVVLETIVSGHNDIVMMFFAMLGLLAFYKRIPKGIVIGSILFFISIFVKGASIILFPLLFLRKYPWDRVILVASFLLLAVFVIAGPIREELYPWYAIWFFSASAFLPYPKYTWVWQFGIALAIGLELRHVPYMAMGYYEGSGPVLRIIVTVVPVVLWGGYKVYRRYKNYKIYRKP